MRNTMKGWIVLMIIFLSNCSELKHETFFTTQELIKIAELSEIQPLAPPIISFPYVYVIGINDSISVTRFPHLKVLYDFQFGKDYHFFYDFLFDVLNQKKKIDTNNPKISLFFSQTFSVDRKISNDYMEKGISWLIQKYFQKENERYTLKKQQMTISQINSISYYLFINKYFRYDDDISNAINFKKLSSILK